MICASDLDPKYVAVCCRCGEDGLKRCMVAMYAKDGSYGTLKVTAHFCRECWAKLLDELGVPEPC